MHIKTPRYLGEQLRSDRKRQGMTQGELADELNAKPNRPQNPFTHQPYNFNRSWVAKLESGTLVRELNVGVRRYLAEVLNANEVLYVQLPTHATSESQKVITDDDNVLPLIKLIAAQPKLAHLSFKKFCELRYADNVCSRSGISIFNPFEPRLIH